MIVAVFCLSLLSGGELLMKEKATVEDRFVRLLEVVDADSLGLGARETLKDVFLGRSPEEGSRSIPS